MEFDLCKTKLKDLLQKNGFKIQRENKKSLIVRSPLGYIYSPNIRVSEVEIKEFDTYLKESTNFEKFKDYGFFTKNYCEHKINEMFFRRDYYRLNTSNKKILFRNNKANGQYICIDSCSKNFFYYLLDINIDFRRFANRIYAPANNEISLTDWIKGIVTIQLFNFTFKDTKTAELGFKQKIDDALFELCLLKNIKIILDEQVNNSGARYKYEVNDKVLEVPKLKYDGESLQHYFMGVNSLHPLLSYLSYYQVMESNFIKASNSELLQDVKKKMLDPRFNLNSDSNLIKLIDTIQFFKAENNERTQLRIVLSSFIDSQKLTKFIEKLEMEYKESYFTKEHVIFEESLKLNFESKNELFRTLADRIYTIRCAIVHAKESSKSKAKYLPCRKNDELLIKELPLMRYLAEETLIGVASKNKLE